MISLGVFQCCITLVLLSVAASLSFFSRVDSEPLSSNRVKRHDIQVKETNVSSAKAAKARNHRCERGANRTLRRKYCHPYSAHGQKGTKKTEKDVKPEVCRSILGDELLFATPAEQEWRENLFVTYSIRFSKKRRDQTMPDFPGQLLNKTCWELIKHMYCKFLLPKCDLTSSKPRPQPICKEACQKFNDRCRNDWVKVLKMYQSKYQLISWGVQSVVSGRMQRGTSLMWCKGLPKRNGPDVPECYYPEMLKDKADPPPTTETCFYGDGQSYRGNASVTQSGYKCQRWSSQCPHRHYRTPKTFPELKKIGNACRNPGGQAPHGPWCYTTNSTVRWEYCRVDKCGSPEEIED